LIAEMMGLSQAIIVWTISPASFITSATLAGLPTMPEIHSRSPPAENARSPAPVITATRVAGSSETADHTRVSSQCRRALVAFIEPGRSMVISSTPSGRCSKRRNSNSSNRITDSI
jgi:hypothetical protein